MPVTLAQAQVNTATDVDYNVIDNLRRYSWLIDQMVFDDTVTPGTGGASLTYGYTRLTSAASAQFRNFNEEYSPGQATRAPFSVALKPLGGAINIDRTLARLGQAATNEITFQIQQITTSTRTRFQQECVLGDTAVDASGFDGLSKALTGSTTEKTAGYLATANSDWTTVATGDNAQSRLDELDDWLSTIVPSHTGSGDQGAPGAVPPGTKAILGNTRSITRLRSLARRATAWTMTTDDLGRTIERYGQWVLVDLGDRLDGSSPIIPLTSNVTDIYAVSFGLDAFHGASPAGQPLMSAYLPDFTQPGAVKTGEVELGPVAAVLKNQRAAGVLRSVTV